MRSFALLYCLSPSLYFRDLFEYLHYVLYFAYFSRRTGFFIVLTSREVAVFLFFCFVLFIKIKFTKITISRHFVHFLSFILIILRLPLLDKLTKSSPCVTRQVYLFKTLVGAQLMAPVQRKAARSAEGWQIFCHFS
jgi:hypothetical protein